MATDAGRDGSVIHLDAGFLDAGFLDAASAPDLGTQDAEAPDLGHAMPDAGSTTDAGTCDVGTPDCPILIDRLPFEDQGNTTQSASSRISQYDCAPTTDESGPEVFYRLTIEQPTLLHIEVDDVSGDGVDVDVHLVEGTASDGSDCVDRDNRVIEAFVQPGSYFVIVDTWVNASGDALAGPYTLSVTSTELPAGRCAMVSRELATFWASCPDGASFHCYEAVDAVDGRTRRFLSTPAYGPVVKEAHLVTVEDDFGGGWPNAFFDGVSTHYQRSEAETGYVMTRSEPWAPAGEGGSEFGQSAFGDPLPVVEESWYVNMYWRTRPTPGTRMIAFNPSNGRAVVVAGGYETGPGSNQDIGGTTEETHHYLGTSHEDAFILGFAADQTLPFGPITCD